VRIRFLGTGASGGTPGRGRSARLESSALVEHGARVLIDATRHFAVQSDGLEDLDAVLLTHGHRDACGGMAALGAWWSQRASSPLPVLASPATIAVVRERSRRLDCCELVRVRPGQPRRIGSLSVTALTVPHARDRRFPTFAWRIEAGDRVLVYASDVARLTSALRRFANGADLLVVDGAMWRRRLHTHLTIDAELPDLCTWPVRRIRLTQIGRTAPPHERLRREVASLCAKAAPAYDGLDLRVGEATDPA